jgi:hypothetical protein
VTPKVAAASGSQGTPTHGDSASTTAHPKHGGPCAEFTQDFKDIGDVDAGGQTAFSFTVKNRGNQPLLISDVEGSCGCVTAQFPRELAPGASGEIQGKFEPNILWHDRMEKHLTVHSNDEKLPEAELKITVNVVPFLKSDPTTPVVVQYRPDTVEKRELQLTARGGAELKLLPNTIPDSKLKATLEPTRAVDGARSYRLKLELTPPKEGGDFNASVRLGTSDPKVTEVPIVVVGLALEGAVVSPREVFVPTLKWTDAGKELRRFQVFTRGRSMKLLGVDTDVQGLKLETKANTPDHNYEVIVSYSGGWKSGPVKGTIHVKTDDPKHAKIDVPFSATVQ